MDEILIFLLKQGAHRAPFRISTTAIGNELSMSQQNASRRMILLEREGAVKRGSAGITITDSGLSVLNEFHNELKNALEGKDEKLEFTGTVVDGLGEGEYYIKKYAKKLKENIGYTPYFGTLNVKLGPEEMQKRSSLRLIEPIIINDFEEDGRKFGGLFLYKCKINDIEGAIIIPMRTHHGMDVLEIVSKEKLREKLGNKRIKITLV